MNQKLKINKAFGQNLRSLRNKNHLTQEEVAAKLQLYGEDTSRSVYAQIECGSYNIRISELVALKEIFHASYEDFFAGMERTDNEKKR
ncbi:MAG: helix-turn-helix transcriptional regulator [Lachnospiraceae bacterium]|nr:helix-turn-helix transcriptional regulator [Lachnospiraceae bacterium]